LDPSFGVSRGFSVLPLNQGGLDRDLATAIGLRPDGRLVLAGFTQTASGTVAGAYQVTKQGLPDSSFGGGDGKATFLDPSEPALSVFILAMLLQSDGKILLAGEREGLPGSSSSGIVLRVLADGTGLDAGFGTGGVVIGVNATYAIALDYSIGWWWSGRRRSTRPAPRPAVHGRGEAAERRQPDSAFAQDGLDYFGFPPAVW
jgi:hypothetical protein